jgi:hypothetical protein
MLPRYFPKMIDDWAIASADSNSGWELDEKEFMGASPDVNKDLKWSLGARFDLFLNSARFTKIPGRRSCLLSQLGVISITIVGARREE